MEQSDFIDACRILAARHLVCLPVFGGTLQCVDLGDQCSPPASFPSRVLVSTTVSHRPLPWRRGGAGHSRGPFPAASADQPAAPVLGLGKGSVARLPLVLLRFSSLVPSSPLTLRSSSTSLYSAFLLNLGSCLELRTMTGACWKQSLCLLGGEGKDRRRGPELGNKDGRDRKFSAEMDTQSCKSTSLSGEGDCDYPWTRLHVRTPRPACVCSAKILVKIRPLFNKPPYWLFYLQQVL